MIRQDSWIAEYQHRGLPCSVPGPCTHAASPLPTRRKRRSCTGWSALALYRLVGLAAAQVTVSFAALRESVDSRSAATAPSVVNSGVFLASAVIQPLFGRLLDAVTDDPSHRTLGDCRLALLLPLAVSLLGLPAAFRMRETYGVPLRPEPAATPDGTGARCAAADRGI
ncbi:hypothetical protein [Streptomyces sp. GS7]|uniref:hypothetical protein n=1 Tax=Streptomyces sp. GS7 TaxID=2692234 RepID=UPI0013182C90|nr:hypothetical protein [Streptomyces sp. GS7]QHC24971.1 hypothetical protein GR130_30000 [Streptomyces sp. GS7]